MGNKGKRFDPEVLTQEEVKKILCAFPATKVGVRNRALTAVYLYGQLRCNEALDLRPSDIDWDRGVLTVRRGKGGKRRIVSLPCEILEDFVRPWSRERDDCEYYFHTQTGKRLHDSQVRKFIGRVAERAGIGHRVHCHGLRHTGAFQLVNNGADLRDLQDQLGHTSLAITERYVKHIGADARLDRIGAIKW